MFAIANLITTAKAKLMCVPTYIIMHVHSVDHARDCDIVANCLNLL